MGYAKVKKKERKSLEKNGHKSVRDTENNGYPDTRMKKKKNKDE